MINTQQLCISRFYQDVAIQSRVGMNIAESLMLDKYEQYAAVTQD